MFFIIIISFAKHLSRILGHKQKDLKTHDMRLVGNYCVLTLPGINAQARKLQKSRSRVTSTLLERTLGRSHKLWRSKSEMDLLDSNTEAKQGASHDQCNEHLNQVPALLLERPQTSPEQSHIHSLPALREGDGGSRAKTESLCPLRSSGEREGEESEREETESSDDNSTQYSIHPPHDCPYLLLLQGQSHTQVSHSGSGAPQHSLSRSSSTPPITEPLGCDEPRGQEFVFHQGKVLGLSINRRLWVKNNTIENSGSQIHFTKIQMLAYLLSCLSREISYWINMCGNVCNFFRTEIFC